MNSEVSFLAAIKNQPADDDLRSVYADFLLERGQPGDAEKAACISAVKRLRDTELGSLEHLSSSIDRYMAFARLRRAMPGQDLYKKRQACEKWMAACFPEYDISAQTTTRQLTREELMPGTLTSHNVADGQYDVVTVKFKQSLQHGGAEYTENPDGQRQRMEGWTVDSPRELLASQRSSLLHNVLTYVVDVPRSDGKNIYMDEYAFKRYQKPVALSAYDGPPYILSLGSSVLPADL